MQKYFENAGRTWDEVEHGFGLAVDSWVKSIGIRTEWKDKDWLYSIPGEIEWNGQRHQGVFTYCFDREKDVCYHRCFMKKTANDIVKEYMEKGFWEWNFPKLERSYDEFRPEVIRNEDGSVVSRVYRNLVEIKDPRNSNATLRLFKVNS